MTRVVAPPALDPGILPRIFDPFFTTKEFGQATGLGLSEAVLLLRQPFSPDILAERMRALVEAAGPIRTAGSAA